VDRITTRTTYRVVVWVVTFPRYVIDMNEVSSTKELNTKL